MKKGFSIFLFVLLLVNLCPVCPLAATALDALTAEQLTNELPGTVTHNLSLPAEVSGTAVTWESSDETVITAEGVVTRDTFTAKPVVLTAKANGAEKEFPFTVAPMTTNVIYQDNFYYPQWAEQDFLTAATGNTIGWSANTSFSYVGTHSITTTADANGQTGYALKKNSGVTARTVYTLPKSPDTLTLSFDTYLDVADSEAAIYDYFFYADDISAFRLRYTFNANGTAEARLYDSESKTLVASGIAAYNVRRQWMNFTIELNQVDHTVSWKIGENILAASLSYGTAAGRLTKMQLQPGNQATCKPMYIDNFFLAEYKNPATYADEVAVEATLAAIGSDTFTAQSSYCVTENLNLSSGTMTNLLAANETEAAFASDNTDVLTIQREVDSIIGVITPRETATDVTLTVSVTKGSVTKAKNILLTVPAESAYVFDSEGFGRPTLKNQYLSALDRWVGPTDTNNFYSKIIEENGSYFVESKRDAASDVSYYTYDFAGMRKTKTVSVEMTLTYKEKSVGGTFFYDFEFYGKDANGSTDTSSRIGYVRINAGTIRAYAQPSGSYGVTRGALSNRLKFEFDFENQGYNLYIDGTKANTALMPFASSVNYKALDHFKFSSFRTASGTHFAVDDFVVKSDAPVYMSSYFEDTHQRPLSLSIGSLTTGGITFPQFSVVSDYNADSQLKQDFALLHEGKTDKNVHYDFSGAYLVDKASGTKTGLLESIVRDETTPVKINNLYLGANHGAHGVSVTAAAHGKTNADVGSLWSDGTNQWSLMRVVDENTLLFLAEINGAANEVFAFPSTIAGNTLSYVSHAENTAAITFTAQVASSQVYPSIANNVHKLYIVRDGVKTEITDIYTPATLSCDEVIMDITYDIMNPALVGRTLRANRPEGGYTEAPSLAVGEALLRYHLWMTVTADGTVLTEFDHEVLQDLRSIEYYGHQFYPKADVFGGGVYRYLPGTKAFTATAADNTTKTFDFSVPYNMTDVFPRSMNLGAEGWAEPDAYVPDRIIDYMRSTTGENVMAYATGYVPIYDAAPDARPLNTSSSIFLYQSKKAYPVFIDSSSFASRGSHIRGVTYRKYADLSANSSGAEIYTINHGNDVYYYVDFLSAASENLQLSGDYKVYNPEIIYKSSNAACTITGDTATVSGNAKDYVVIRASRGLELAEAVYDKAGSKATVRIDNHNSTPQDAAIILASYKDGKLMALSTPTEISLEAGATLLKDITYDADQADAIKVFVWSDMNTLVPLGKAKDIED